MATKGVQEEKFVRERAIKAMVILSNRNARHRIGGKQELAANNEDKEEQEEEEEDDDSEGTPLNDEERAIRTSTPQSDRDAFTMSPLSSVLLEDRSIASTSDSDESSSSDPELDEDGATTLTAKDRKRKLAALKSEDEETAPATEKAKPATFGPIPTLFIDIWSADKGRSLIRLALKDVVQQGSCAPSIDRLREEVLSVLPSTCPLLSIPPEDLFFTHVLYDGTNAMFIRQEVLEMEWNDWRRGAPKGRTFYLYVDDRSGPEPHKRVQPPKKMAWGAPLIQPMLVRLPLQT